MDVGLKGFLKFIVERHAIYTRREAGQPWPWTADPILQQYRFCNVYRNLDKESKLIHSNWLQHPASGSDVWFAMAVARLVNWWPTLAEVGYPVPWRPKAFVKALDKRKVQGEKVFTGAYMVRADPHVSGSKGAYIAESVLTPMWQKRAELRPRQGDTLNSFHERLMGNRDMGSFMAAQIVADVKYAAGPLGVATDWTTWAASGPGSRRGLNRLHGNAVDKPWKETDWRLAFAQLHKLTTLLIAAHSMPFITGQDLQNCLCEFDKYERVRLKEGTPRSKYINPTGDNK